MRFKKGDTVTTSDGNRAIVIDVDPLRGYYVRFILSGMHGWRPAGKLGPSGFRTKVACWFRNLRTRLVVHA